jgi:hypothetical protein
MSAARLKASAELALVASLPQAPVGLGLVAGGANSVNLKNGGKKFIKFPFQYLPK